MNRTTVRRTRNRRFKLEERVFPRVLFECREFLFRFRDCLFFFVFNLCEDISEMVRSGSYVYFVIDELEKGAKERDDEIDHDDNSYE